MKIIFICGRLEPGKDGVGDYTRRLACELIRKGTEVGVIALNDAVNTVCFETQESEGTPLKALRIPNTYSKCKQAKLAKRWIEEFNPEWLSLQFVPYSFNRKGIPLILPWQLKKMGGTRHWHIMFHELWLGLRDNDSLKFKIIGSLQKMVVKAFTHVLKVKIVHTHTTFYLNQLRELNLTPKYLPIFSNIPFAKKQVDEFKVSSDTKNFIIFGTIHPKAPVEDFALEMSNYFKKNRNLDCCLVLAGKSGFEQNRWVKEFEKRNINVIVLGELSSEAVSHALQDASFGITSNPMFVVEKSGTVAAMREHNLPIIVVAEKTSPKNNVILDLGSDLLEYQSGNFEKLIEEDYGSYINKGLEVIAIQFLKDLH